MKVFDYLLDVDTKTSYKNIFLKLFCWIVLISSALMLLFVISACVFDKPIKGITPEITICLN